MSKFDNMSVPDACALIERDATEDLMRSHTPMAEVESNRFRIWLLTGILVCLALIVVVAMPHELALEWQKTLSGYLP